MDNDFIIRPAKGRWQIVATSERGKAFAVKHPRFEGDKADLDAAEALNVYQKVHEDGFYATAPAGLPPAGNRLIFSRLVLVLALLLLPVMLFLLLF